MIVKLSLDEWNKGSEDIHKYSFDEIRKADMNTFDYALMAIQDEKPMAYCTCIELDRESVYMQHGGSLPAAHGTINVAKAYSHLIRHLKKNYKNLSTKILNRNTAMIKLAISAGFIPTGIDVVDGDTFLHLNIREN